MKLLLSLVRMSRGTLTLAFAASVVSGATSAATLAVVHQALVAPRDSNRLALVFLVLCVVRLVAAIVSERLLIVLGQDLVCQIRVRLSAAIVRADLRPLERAGPHRLLTTLTGDALEVAQAAQNLPQLSVSAAALAGSFAYIAWLSLPAFVATVIFIGIAVIVVEALMAPGRRATQRAREEQNELYQHIRGLTEGVKDLKLGRARAARFLAGLLEPAADRLRRLGVDALTWFATATNVGQTGLYLLIGWLVFAAPAAASGESTTVMGIALVILYAAGPLRTLLATAPWLSRASVALAHIERLGLSLEPDDALRADAAPRDEFAGWRTLRLSGVVHAYQADGDAREFVLGPVDLECRRGEIVFITGGNGSGKTTLAKTIAGLYVPDRGDLRLGSRLVDAQTQQAYREQVAAVFADSHLFTHLLDEDASAPPDRVRAYLDRFGLSARVSIADGRWSTTDLSSGQRKRLLLVCACLQDRPIVLLDEWAAEQDREFRDVFYRVLLPELRAQQRLVIVISHDDRFFDMGDRIIRLDAGQVVAVTDGVSHMEVSDVRR